jgi:glycosyltransferase involved in cell wall biosynthesis
VPILLRAAVLPYAAVSNPRATVLMSVFNDEPFLAEAIESILGQTFADFELLVIDDASTDGSRRVAESFRDPRVRVVANPVNLGLTRSLNRGLAMAGSEYVARLDGNDVSFPTRLARQVAWLDAHPEVAALGVQAAAIDTKGRRIRRVALFTPQWRRPSGGLALEWYRAFDTPFIHSGVMFRREVVTRLGGYDERHPLEQDAELWARIGRHEKLANLEEELVALRCDPSSMTADPQRPERRGYAERKTAIVRSLLSALLRDEELAARLAGPWVAANDPHARRTAGQLRELGAMLDEAAARFFELHPEARHDREIARHRVSTLSRLVDKADRATIVALFVKMLRVDFRSALSVLPRAAAFLLFGEATLPLWRRRPS